LGRFQEALSAHEKAISIDPNKAEFWSNKGAGLIKLDRLQDALKAFDKAIEINPNLSVTRYNIACIYSLTREKAKALEHLSNAISLGVKNKKRAKTDEDFKWLLEDEEFKRLTAD
jgi:Flp pilus assembly protein TadD